jgi:hypothetical protein
MSFVPDSHSGAPPSSTLMWAEAGQIVASHGRRTARSTQTFAPVPLKTRNARACGPKCSRSSSSARAVHGSAP